MKQSEGYQTESPEWASDDMKQNKTRPEWVLDREG